MYIASFRALRGPQVDKNYQRQLSTWGPPSRWLHGKVIFLPKPGKTDYTKIGAYRPITLASFQFKTMEKVLMWEFEESRLDKQPMHQNQHGFRGGQSTETALTTFLAPIEQAIIRDQFSIVALLDADRPSIW